MTNDKKRARRIASDEAHAWARSLQLDNAAGKSVLRALTLYVNGEGACFVSIEQISFDTDLSHDTVRRRLVWLDQIGAIVRMPQWIDSNGRRNSDGKGKRTTDEIRLLLDADTDAIEARARGAVDEISPSREQPQDFTTEEASPSVALGQPSQSCDHLISEPEPEDSPQPPSGGSVASLEGWKEFEIDWGEPILRQSLAQQVWAALKPDERDMARKAARGYVAHRKVQRKPPNVIGAHLFLKERAAWEAYAKFDATVSAAGSYPRDGLEAKALASLYALAGAFDFFVKYIRKNDAVYYRHPVTPQLAALARAPQQDEWIICTRNQAGAWEALLRQYPTIDRRHHMREGDRAPWPFPPSKEGKIYTETGAPSGDLMTDEDYQHV